MNKSDSERVAAVLEHQGFQSADNKNQADLVVFNTCGVRQSAEDRVYGLVPRIKRENPKVKIVLTGCLVNRGDVRSRLKDYVDAWLPINQIFNFPARFAPARFDSRSESGRQFSISKQIPPRLRSGQANSKSKCQFSKQVKNPKSKIGDCDYLKIRPKYSSKFSAFVPIGNGCNNFCSYCVVPYARGREVYRPAREIISEVRGLVKKGYKEIVLIAQNVNSYKDTNETNSNRKKRINGVGFADLLMMVNNIVGDFWIKFATSHPKDMSDKLIETIAKSKKVAPFIHLPVQSGDNEILRKMNRNYTATQYKKLIKKIRAAFKKYRPISKVEISTDIIVGFPGETKKQFQNTVKLARDIKFDKAYIARYSPRPGTAAARLKDDVLAEEKKRRWQTLENLINKPTDHRY